MEYLTLKPGSADYPRRLKERLGREAPVLYARGPLPHLSRWTLAFMTADIEPNVRAVWDMFFPVLEYEMNAVGGWQSVNEGVFLRSALDMPWISLTLFTARGIERETNESFLADRHRPPQDYFLQKPEYERRAAAGELLMLSISPPEHQRQSRDVVLQRNWIACNLADVVFIGGAARVQRELSAKTKKLVPKRQKTFMLARRLATSGIPVFTVDHPDNRELIDLGVTAHTPASVHAFLASLGAKRMQPGAALPGRRGKRVVVIETPPPAPAPPPRPAPLRQRTLFEA